MASPMATPPSLLAQAPPAEDVVQEVEHPPEEKNRHRPRLGAIGHDRSSPSFHLGTADERQASPPKQRSDCWRPKRRTISLASRRGGRKFAHSARGIRSRRVTTVQALVSRPAW